MSQVEKWVIQSAVYVFYPTYLHQKGFQIAYNEKTQIKEHKI